MQVIIPHQLGRVEVRHRLKTRSPELGKSIPGGMAQVTTEWPSQDRMNLTVTAMGQMIAGYMDIHDTDVEVVLDLPPMLSFIQPLVEGAIRQQGQLLLAPPKPA